MDQGCMAYSLVGKLQGKKFVQSEVVELKLKKIAKKKTKNKTLIL